MREQHREHLVEQQQREREQQAVAWGATHLPIGASGGNGGEPGPGHRVRNLSTVRRLRRFRLAGMLPRHDAQTPAARPPDAHRRRVRCAAPRAGPGVGHPLRRRDRAAQRHHRRGRGRSRPPHPGGGERQARRGEGPRAYHGVTAVFPRGRDSDDPVFAGWFTMNGNGEMTGTTWVEESGFLWGPVIITNTHSVGVVRDAVIEWVVRRGRMRPDEKSFAGGGGTWGGGVNDINGVYRPKKGARAAIGKAPGGPLLEGSG